MSVNIYLCTVLIWYLDIGTPVTAGAAYRLAETEVGGLIGVLQVNVTGTWGPVCSFGLSEREARVVCRTIGLPHSDARPLMAECHGECVDVARTDRSDCRGNESSLDGCPGMNHWVPGCPGGRVIRVFCSSASENKFRMIGRGMLSAGRVEVFYHGQWGTIQLKRGIANATTAQVLCKSLGFPFGMARYVHGSSGSGRVWLQDVECAGHEDNWMQCSHQLYTAAQGVANHDLDVSISCEDLRQRPGEALTGYFQDEWRPVFSEYFDDLAATVACKVMGLPRSGATVLREVKPSSSDYQTTLDVLSCSGYEERLTECMGSKWTHRTAGKVTIQCARADTTGVKFRLWGARSPAVGRLEVYRGNRWRLVCGDRLSQATVTVACRTLGLPRAGARQIPTSYTGKGTGDISLYGVTCKGDEASLLDCHFNRWENGVCNQSNALAIFCHSGSDMKDYDLRLVDGKDNNSGRVEISLYGIWHRICRDVYSVRNSLSAAVICRQLDLPRSYAKTTNCFEEGTNRYWADQLGCTGNETTLQDCRDNMPLVYTTGCQPLRVICSSELVDDSNCFGTSAWMFVLIGVTVTAALIAIVCVIWRVRRLRTAISQRSSQIRVRCTLAVSVGRPDTPARVEIELPPPSYSDSPPAYDAPDSPPVYDTADLPPAYDTLFSQHEPHTATTGGQDH